jgi:hypothetical protein
VENERLGHAHIGVATGAYAHVRLHLQRQATPRGQGPITAQRPWPGGQPEMPLRHGPAEVISSFRDLRAATRLDAVD